VLVAEPGAGKTTRVPPAILRGDLLSQEHPNIVMLQPRRVAARAAAMRNAEENGWSIGDQVGYHVRFDRKIGPRTRLRVVTEGILTRQLLDDPFLDGVGCVVLDEFHERSIHTDLAIAMLREVRQTVREDLILIVMSATLDAQPVARFLDHAPIISVPGRLFPIEIEHRPAHDLALVDRVADAVRHEIEQSGRGDVLVFLPGADEIRRVHRNVAPDASERDVLVLPLHGSLPANEQIAALAPASRRKVILATNIAETSLTMEGVTTVIDSGFARVASFDAERGLDRLDLKRISKASARQRAGRAGRTAPGRCIRLWSAKEDHELADHELPEIQRVDLAATVLAVHSWGKSEPRNFGWFEPPPPQMLESAERLLAMLGALDNETSGKLTPLGKSLMRFPAHPRLARLMLAAAEMGVVEEGAAIAALLSEKDIAATGEATPTHASTIGDSDLLIRLEMLKRAEQRRFYASLRSDETDPVAARQVVHARDQLLRIARGISPPPLAGGGRGEGEASNHSTLKSVPKETFAATPPPNPLPQGEGGQDQLLKLPLLAYPDRVCRRRGADPASAVMVGGGGVRLARESVVARAEFFVALDARHDQRSAKRESLVRIASAIELQWLEELFPQSIQREQTVEFDEKSNRTIGVSRMFYRDLLLREDRGVAVDAQQAADVLVGAIRPKVRQFFLDDPAVASWLSRLELLRKHMPEHSWPVMDDEVLRQLLNHALQGKRGLDELKAVPLVPLLASLLHYPLDRILETEAPTHLQVPTGNRIRLDYGTDAQTVMMSVRLQELFGLQSTPKIAAGRVPVVLELLGPNFRPVQVTSDLASFWKNTYPQVRKDLRARYPKHSWPEDPLTARPEAKGSRRR
jgi:ATP-dependent helicase HrpB